MRKMYVLIVVVFVSLCGCSNPACSREYTKRGDAAAIKELRKEYKSARESASQNNDRMLLLQMRNFLSPVDYYKMEEWVCQVQRKYGRNASEK